MKTIDQIETCTAVKRTVDAHVRITPGRYSLGWRASDGMEKYAKALEGWAKDVKDFFRDHRHQDVNDVYVERDVVRSGTGTHPLRNGPRRGLRAVHGMRELRRTDCFLKTDLTVPNSTRI